MTTISDTRRPLNHERTISYRSFAREDGLFDIEGHLRDAKGYDYTDRERGTLQPGSPVHDIWAMLTIDAGMTVRDFRNELRATPFGYCQGAIDPSRLIGASIARGWRKALSEAFGQFGGCTHLREMVFGMGTVAFQTISALRDQRMFGAGGSDADRTEVPFFLDGCHSWARTSPVVATYMPQFHTSVGDNDDPA